MSEKRTGYNKLTFSGSTRYRCGVVKNTFVTFVKEKLKPVIELKYIDKLYNIYLLYGIYWSI